MRILRLLASLTLALMLRQAAQAQWVKTDAPYYSWVTSLGVRERASDTTIIAGSAKGRLSISTDQGSSWSIDSIPYTPLFFGDVLPITALEFKDPFMFAGTSQGVFRSLDDGLTWQAANYGLHGYLNTNRQINALLMKDSILFAATVDSVYRSTDMGAHWVILRGMQGPATYFSNLGVNALAAKGAYVFAGTFGEGVFTSANNGDSWLYKYVGGVSGGGYFVRSLAVSGGDVYAGMWNYWVTSEAHIFRSTDNGDHWIDASAGLWGMHVMAIVASGNALYAGTYQGGVFLSTNQGASWDSVNTGLPHWDWPVRCMAATRDYLFVGTENGGLWRRPLKEMTTDVHDRPDPDLPGAYKLEQNYPNPFNPSTTIRYVLPQRSHMTLKVYSLLGQAVATLVNNVIEAGYHEVQFDGSGLASGVYFYRLQAGEFTQVRKLCLMR